MMSAFLINGTPIECINQAAIEYHVPATMIISVLKTENGKTGMATPDKNGTYDYGQMQINTVWVKAVKPYGYTRRQIQYNPCINIMVGTWILAKEIAGSNDYWQGVGDYHSMTVSLNEDYQAKVKQKFDVLSKNLSS